ncbi:hypothetical protein BC826DRAFT_167095 [Russula brevipes]|nr:hypothetical protein BC826DRAFT_167095 [Russula brevipes]
MRVATCIVMPPRFDRSKPGVSLPQYRALSGSLHGTGQYFVGHWFRHRPPSDQTGNYRYLGKSRAPPGPAQVPGAGRRAARTHSAFLLFLGSERRHPAGDVPGPRCNCTEFEDVRDELAHPPALVQNRSCSAVSPMRRPWPSRTFMTASIGIP